MIHRMGSTIFGLGLLVFCLVVGTFATWFEMLLAFYDDIKGIWRIK